MKAAILYTLILVTYGADVKHTDGFTSLRACEQAKSIAKTGKTLEKIEAEAQSAREAAAKRKAEWETTHPPRPRLLPDDACNNQWSPHPCRILDSGLVQDDEPPVTTWTGVVGYLTTDTDNAHSIKFAECVVIPKAAR